MFLLSVYGIDTTANPLHYFHTISVKLKALKIQYCKRRQLMADFTLKLDFEVMALNIKFQIVSHSFVYVTF